MVVVVVLVTGCAVGEGMVVVDCELAIGANDVPKPLYVE